MEAVKKVLFVLLILFLFSSFTKTIADYFRNLGFYEDIRAEYEKERKLNTDLKTKIAKNRDPYQLEKNIRNNLNLTRENEVVVILPKPTEAPVTPQPTAAPVWRQWGRVFFSRN